MTNNKSLKEALKWVGPLLGFGWLFIVFYAQHFVKCNDVIGFEQFNAAFEHMSTKPFDIFPIDMAAIGIVTFWFAIVCAFLYIEYLRRKRLRTTGEHGTAAWNTDMKAYNRTYSAPKGEPYADKSSGDAKDWDKRNKNVILSNNVFLNINGRETMRNLNVLVAGGSGSGKSRFVVKPNLLQANCSFVVTDPKGELLKATGSFLKERGYKIKVFNLVDFEQSSHYNPFHYIRDPEGVMMMINTLIKNTTDKGASKGDPFWEKAETSLLQAICFYLWYECNEEDQNFSSIMRMLRCAEVKEEDESYKSTLDIMMERLEEKDPAHIAVLQYKVFKQAAGKTAKSILITAQTRLANFNIPTLANLTNDDSLDLTKIGDEKTALFVIIKDSDDTFNFLVALMYSQLFESLYFHADKECEDLRLPYHVRFLLDEFANIGTVPDFEKKLATMRSREISCTIIIQNLAQLKTMYKDSWESITGNCDTFIFLGGQEQTTLEYVSKKLGKETIVTQTDSRSFGGKGGGSSRSKQIIGRELMTSTEISEMDNSDCIVFIRGLKPFKDKKYDYEKHPNYSRTGDANKKFNYDLKKEFKPEPKPIPANHALSNKKRIRVYAEKSETRIEEKMERQRIEVSTKMRKKSSRGTPLYTPMPMEKGFEQLAFTTEPEEWYEGKIISYSDGYVPEGLDEFSENEFEEMELEMDDGVNS